MVLEESSTCVSCLYKQSPSLFGLRSNHFGIRSSHPGPRRYRPISRPIFLVVRFNSFIHSFQYHSVHHHHQKLSFFPLLKPNSACLASYRWIHSPCYPLCSAAEALAKGALACKRSTDRNTKTTTTTTTTTNTKTKTTKYRLFLGFSSIESKSLIK